MEHTKGPWTADAYLVRGPNNAAIAILANPVRDEYESMRIRRVNARLIAKAPELLETCNSLAALAYSLMAPAQLPQCYHDAMRIIAEVKGTDNA